MGCIAYRQFNEDAVAIIDDNIAGSVVDAFDIDVVVVMVVILVVSLLLL